jgi:hypothetical protein
VKNWGAEAAVYFVACYWEYIKLFASAKVCNFDTDDITYIYCRELNDLVQDSNEPDLKVHLCHTNSCLCIFALTARAKVNNAVVGNN